MGQTSGPVNFLCNRKTSLKEAWHYRG